MDGRVAAIFLGGAAAGAAAYALATAFSGSNKALGLDAAPFDSIASSSGAAARLAPTQQHAASQPPPLPPAAQPDFSNFEQDEILQEQFTRNVQFFGQAGQLSVAKSFVVVIGLGGVGSHAAHLLLRSGVGRLRLVDFDQVSLSSLNRHAVATRADVGLPKSACMERHFKASSFFLSFLMLFLAE